MTYDAEALTDAHFVEVGADPATPVVGLPANGALRGVIEREAPYDAEALARDVLEAAGRLVGRGDVGAILMECTNLPPFSRAVAERFAVRSSTSLPWAAGFTRAFCKHATRKADRRRP